MKNRLRLKSGSIQSVLVKICISAGLLWFFWARADLHSLASALKNLSIKAVVLYGFINVALVLINAVKWKSLLRDFTVLTLFKMYLAGYFYGFVLPGQLFGEVAKAYILGKNTDKAEKVAASVFMDKATGVLCMIVVGIAGSLLSNDAVSSHLLFLFSLLLAIASVFFIISRKSFQKARFIERVPDKIRFLFVKKVIIKLFLFAGYLSDYLNNQRQIAGTLFWGIISQLITAYILWGISNECGVTLSYWAWCWIQAVLSLAMLLPWTIGGLGLREGTLVYLLGSLGIVSEKALAISLVIFALNVSLVIVGGILELVRISSTRNLRY